MFLIKRVPAARVATYAYVNPVIAVLLGCVLGREPFSPRLAVGTLIVLGGVVLVNLAKIATAPAEVALE
jgi:drug/metabolite transporter (DMT)-like permease